MMTTWAVMYMVLQIGQGEVILRPHRVYKTMAECLHFKDKEAKKLNVPMKCDKPNEIWFEKGIDDKEGH